LIETKLPPFPYGPILSAILNAEQGSIFEPLIASGKVNELADPAQIAGLKASLEVAAKDYLKAMRIRRLIKEAYATLFADVDALVTTGRSGPAPPVNQPLDAGPAAPGGFNGIIQAGNLAGLPALAFPCGFADKSPVALQVVGPPWSEDVLLAIGKAFQSGTDWHKRRP
jgi:aspartyl-tRNA(Asn)/glutamyl-tRNA(Gln) amidotransferase subunit A